MAMGLPSAWVLGFVLPGERVLAQIVEARRAQGPLHVDLRLRGQDPAWPGRITLELHPELGAQVRDEHGRRWVLREGQLLGRKPAPAWLPDVDVLALRSTSGLRAWLRQQGIDLDRSELARCGESDCYVLGGRDSRGQLWVDKDRFDVVRWIGRSGRRVELRGFKPWGRQRFPSEIEVLDHMGEFASMVVETVIPATDLVPADFEP
jgi:hypothetical protein